jgi:hypothetical protein
LTYVGRAVMLPILDAINAQKSGVDCIVMDSSSWVISGTNPA